MPAVLALREEAEANRSAGDFENAASGLERALRIQPRNPQLWHDLAKIRLAQGQGALAEELARKSTVLAEGDERLIADNEALIVEARRGRGGETPSETTGE
jgi:cytochrome c-type biogenesis protein CcmH/NrfG